MTSSCDTVGCGARCKGGFWIFPATFFKYDRNNMLVKSVHYIHSSTKASSRLMHFALFQKFKIMLEAELCFSCLQTTMHHFLCYLIGHRVLASRLTLYEPEQIVVQWV